MFNAIALSFHVFWRLFAVRVAILHLQMISWEQPPSFEISVSRLDIDPSEVCLKYYYVPCRWSQLWSLSWSFIPSWNPLLYGRFLTGTGLPRQSKICRTEWPGEPLECCTAIQIWSMRMIRDFAISTRRKSCLIDTGERDDLNDSCHLVLISRLEIKTRWQEEWYAERCRVGANLGQLRKWEMIPSG